jgi:hypothetical protein
MLLSACGEAGAATDNNPGALPSVVSAPADVSPTPVAVAVDPPSAAAPILAPPPVDPYAAATAAGATAVCADGTWSYSQNRSGTCSHHGGVHWWTGNLGAAGPGAH